MKFKRMTHDNGGGYNLTKMVSVTQNPVQAGVYTILLNDDGLSVVRDRSRFSTVEKVYGPAMKHYMRLSRLLENDKTGLTAMFVGDAGCGKSHLAEMLANAHIDMGGIVLMVTVNTPLHSELLSEVCRYFTDIPVMVYFDELDRIYPMKEEDRSSHHAQDRIMQFFSDSDFKRVHKLVTSNGRGISDVMLNRPGRIRYALDSENFYLTDDDYASILNDRGIKGSAFAFLHQSLSVNRTTVDESITVADLLSGYTCMVEAAAEIDVLNVRIGSSYLHGVSLCNNNVRDRLKGTYRSTITRLDGDLDAFYRIEVQCDGETVYSEVHPYPNKSFTIELDEVTVQVALVRYMYSHENTSLLDPYPASPSQPNGKWMGTRSSEPVSKNITFRMPSTGRGPTQPNYLSDDDSPY